MYIHVSLSVLAGMKGYKKGDRVILNPPGGYNPTHNLLMGKEATIMGDCQGTDDLKWYPIQLAAGALIPVPAKWLRKKDEKANDSIDALS